MVLNRFYTNEKVGGWVRRQGVGGVGGAMKWMPEVRPGGRGFRQAGRASPSCALGTPLG